MTAVVIGGLRMRKLRAVLTALAVVLGVAMISGTYVLMDTTTHAFNSVFATEYSKADAVVVGKSPISGPGLSAPSVPAAVVARIRALAQVQDVQGFILDTRAQLRTAQGGAISGTTVAVGGPGAHSASTQPPSSLGGGRSGRAKSRSTSRPPPATTLASAPRSGLCRFTRLSISGWSGSSATAVSGRSGRSA